jgi:hypothetical protein
MRKLIFVALVALLLAFLVFVAREGQATDNQSNTTTYRVSPRGSGVQVGSLIFDQPAARDSAETDSLLIQFGKFTLDTDPDTIKFASEGMVAYSVTPTVIGLTRVGDMNVDSLFVPVVTSVRDSMLIIRMWYTTRLDSIGTIGKGTVHYATIGPR